MTRPGVRQRHGQYAVLERRRNLVAQHFDVERNTTLEGAIGALGIRVAPLLLFLLELFFTPDRQDVVGQRHLDVLLVETGQLGGDDDLVILLADVDPRRDESSGPLETSQQRHIEATPEILEQPIHLPLERHQRVLDPTSARHVPTPTPRNQFTHVQHLLLLPKRDDLRFRHACFRNRTGPSSWRPAVKYLVSV